MGADRSHQPDSWSAPEAESAGSGAAREPFSVIVHRPEARVVVVSVAGEIDLITESSLRGHLSRLLATRPDRLVIDLSHVSFMGARALSVLLSARCTATQQGTTLQLRAPNRKVMARVLEITGLDRLVGTEPDEYAHLVPLQWRYAGLASDDPERQRLRERLISGYLPVAEHIAFRFAGRGEPLDDLVQVATVGLINAVDRFNPARGSHFLSFAVPTITGELRRHFRDHGWSTRMPRRLKDLSLAIRGADAQLSQQLGRAARPSEIADRLALPISDVIEALLAGAAYRSSSLDEMLSSADTTAKSHKFIGEVQAETCFIDDCEALRPLLAELAPRERTILALRFFDDLSQSQIAELVASPRCTSHGYFVRHWISYTSG